MRQAKDFTPDGEVASHRQGFKPSCSCRLSAVHHCL